MKLLKTDESAGKDKFGLPKLSTNTEIAISFTLTLLGFLLVLVTSFTIYQEVDVDLSPLYLGLLLILSGYFFLMESVRELEQKDHFLSAKLMSRKEEEEDEEE